MHDDDPAETVWHLLRPSTGHWDASNTLGIEPRVHTGWYDYGAGGQQVTVSNPDQTVVGGGSTGYTAGTGDGRGAQVWAGTVTVNAWAGTRAECRGLASDGSDINPKKLAYEFAAEVSRIIGDHADGVIDGTPIYNSLGVGSARRLADDEGGNTVYRWELRVGYTYGDTAGTP